MSILKEIVQRKRQEVDDRQALYPVKLLEQSVYFDTDCVSLKRYLLRPDKSGIIAEIKRKSPSRSWINRYVSVEKTSIGYMQAGASALSVLTDEHYFGAQPQDLKIARDFNYCPILRKDFIIDEYQVIEAKSMGADAILLIASILNDEHLRTLYRLAKSLGLEVLFETHSESEIQRVLNLDPELIGVNSRNLATFSTDQNHLFQLKENIPDGVIAIAESGIETVTDLLNLKEAGYQGFLIGTRFMRHSQPEEACKQFIRSYIEASY